MEPANATHQFSRANAILEDALDLPDGEREAFAAGRCDGEGTLCGDVLRLLAFARKQDDFLERPPHGFGISPGDLLGGRFRIKEKLGEGGMGAVFLADDAQLGEVALKTIRMEMRGDRRAMERFRAEIRLGRSVSHRNVCPVFDLFTLDHPSCGGLAAFTMKYVRGETLAARISRGRMPVAELLPVARGIAAGLDALHAEGIVHCDLKPANILLATGGNGEAVPVITDFGLARRDALRPGEGAAPSGEIAGSPDYMAPEQFGDGPVTKAVDIYAFGILLFEMTTGQRPFPKEDLLAAAIRRITKDAVAPNRVAPDIPRGWNRAIVRALARDAAARPRTAGEVVDLAREPRARTDALPAQSLRLCCHRRRGER